MNILGIFMIIAAPYAATWVFPILARLPKVSTTISWTVLQSAGLAILLLFAMYCAGRARLEFDAHKGRRVDVVEFVDGRRTQSGMSAKELTADFKGKLNTSRIYSPTAVPGTAGTYDFVQIVENAAEAASGGWWKMAARLVRLFRPPAAYRVTGTVVVSGIDGRHRLVVELVRLPGFAAQGNAMITACDHL